MSYVFKYVRKLGKVLSIACLLALISSLCRAAIVYVDSSDDSGTYTLRNAITTSNSDNADTTIRWRYTGGTISLGSSLPNINGVTTLDVDNAYSAVTLYSSDDDYTLGLGGTVTIRNDATANPMTISVILISTGSLTKDGDGTLYLTKDNTYSGGTIFKKGIISISEDSNLGAASGALTFDGGTLHIRDDVSSARGVILNSGGGTIDTNQSYTLALTGVISGAGGLTKISDGTLVLSGANTYTGGTMVSSGTLQLGADNTLPIFGAVAVTGGATLALGGYTQAIGGYSGGGTLSMLLQTGVPNLNVTGTAVLTDGKLVLSISPQIILVGQTFTPITAGTITGTFSTIVSPAAIIFTPSYSGNDVVLTAGLVPFTDVAATANQRAVGASLEPLRISPSGDITTVIANMYTLNTAQLRSALDQIGPFSLASMRGIGMAGAGLQSAAVNQRMSALADGSDRGGFASYKFSGPSSYPGTIPAAAVRGEKAAARQSAEKGPDMPWGFFASGVGTVGRVKEATDIQPGYKFYSAGLIVGSDYRINDHLAAGFFGGYLAGRASVSSPDIATVDNRSARYGVYASGYSDTFHVNLYAGRAVDYYTTGRDIVFGDISRKATAKPDGDEVNLSANAGYDIKMGGRAAFSPYAGLNYDRLKIDAFREKGAESLNLNVSAQEAESLRSSLGVRYSDVFIVDSYLLASYVRAGWQHEFKDQSPIESQLASGAGGVFSVATGNFARDAALLGIGFSVNWGERTTASLDYSCDLYSHLTEQVLSAGVRIKF